MSFEHIMPQHTRPNAPAMVTQPYELRSQGRNKYGRCRWSIILKRSGQCVEGPFYSWKKANAELDRYNACL